MIENERNPSWVPLVTLFLPVGDGFCGFSTLCEGPGILPGPLSFAYGKCGKTVCWVRESEMRKMLKKVALIPETKARTAAT